MKKTYAFVSCLLAAVTGLSADTSLADDCKDQVAAQAAIEWNAIQNAARESLPSQFASTKSDLLWLHDSVSDAQVTEFIYQIKKLENEIAVWISKESTMNENDYYAGYAKLFDKNLAVENQVESYVEQALLRDHAGINLMQVYLTRHCDSRSKPAGTNLNPASKWGPHFYRECQMTPSNLKHNFMLHDRPNLKACTSVELELPRLRARTGVYAQVLTCASVNLGSRRFAETSGVYRSSAEFEKSLTLALSDHDGWSEAMAFSEKTYVARMVRIVCGE